MNITQIEKFYNKINKREKKLKIYYDPKFASKGGNNPRIFKNPKFYRNRTF